MRNLVAGLVNSGSRGGSRIVSGIVPALIVSALMAVGAAASAAGDAELRVSLTEQKEALPEQFVTHVLTLENTGSHEEVIEWEAFAPEGWGKIAFPPSVLTLGPGESEMLFLNVQVPRRHPVGSFPFIIHVSRERDGAVWTLESGVQVLPQRSVVIDEGPPTPGLPGQQATHVVRISNLGNVPETLRLTVSSSAEWPVEPGELAFSLDPGETRSVDILVQIPVHAAAGDYPHLTVAVEGEDGHAHGDALLITAVPPPTPDAVPALRTDTLPSHVRFDTGRMRSGRRWDPSLTYWSRGVIGDRQRFDIRAELRRDRNEQTYLRRFQFDYTRLPWEFRLALRQGSATDRLREEISLTYNERPWWVSGGDVRFRLSELVYIRGRGGAGRYFAPSGLDVGALVLDNQHGATLGYTFMTEDEEGPREQGLLRTSYLRRSDPDDRVWSVGGEWWLSRYLQLAAERAAVDDRPLWFAGLLWQESPWRGKARYFSYGDELPGEGRGNHHGYELELSGLAGEVPLYAYAADTRTNPLNDPGQSTISSRSLAFSTAFPVRQASVDMGIAWERVKHVTVAPGDEEIDRDRLKADLRIHRQFDRWFWRVDGLAQWLEDRMEDEKEAEFRLGPTVGRSWDRVHAGIGFELFGEGEDMAEAWEGVSLAPTGRLDYYGPRPTRTRITLEARGGRIPRLGARIESYVTSKVRMGVAGDVRYRDDRDRHVTVRAWIGWDFDFPMPGVYSRGKLSGRLVPVGKASEAAAGSNGLGGIVIRAAGLRVSTDKDGYFEFPPMPPGEYALTLEEMPVAFETLTEMPLTVTVERGKRTEADISVRLMSRVTGRVYRETLPRTARERELPLSGIALEYWRDGQLVAVSHTDDLGFYESPLLEPGSYEVRVTRSTLPRGSAVKETDHRIVSLRVGELHRLDIALVERPLEIRVDVTDVEEERNL